MYCIALYLFTVGWKWVIIISESSLWCKFNNYLNDTSLKKRKGRSKYQYG